MSSADFWVGPTTNVPVVNADGNIFEETQLALAAQTVFTLLTFEYTPATHSIFVWKNGEMLRRNVDYAETSSTVITVATPAALNDKFTFIAFAIQQIIPPVVFNGMPAGGTSGQVLVKTTGSDYEADWEDAATATTLLDAARTNIASASTVNLSAIAATTRNIQITGNTQIDGFQVSNGQVWAAKFASYLVIKNNANIVTQSGQDIRVSPDDTCWIRAIADNVVELLSYTRAASSIPRLVNDFRLTLTAGTPVTTADVVGAGTIYLTPYTGDCISLFNGSSWIMRQSAEVSLALAALTPSLPYDIFAYDNAGVVSLEFTAWASATARVSAISRQNGIYVKSADTTRRYLGTFYTTAAATTEDSERRRLLWNYYNRVTRQLLRQETAASWNYTLLAIRQANANVLNQVEYVCGVQEDSIEVTVATAASNTGAGVAVIGPIGVDSITVSVARSAQGRTSTSAAASVHSMVATYKDIAALGFHYISWLESSSAAGTTTWYGTTLPGSGLFGLWRC